MEKNNKIKVDIWPEKSVLKPLDFFVLRTPLLGVDNYYSLAESTKKAPRVNDLLKRHPKVESAVAVGNPSFYEAIKKSIIDEQDDQSKQERNADAKQKPGKEEKDGKDSDKVLGKLLRVLTRMATRPTPFGLYAGVTLGTWGEKSAVTLKETGDKSRTRLDMELLAKAALGLEKELLHKLQVVANPTLRQFTGRLYLLEKAPVLDEQEVDGSWLEATEEVLEVVAMTQSPISYATLLNQLADKCQMYEEDAEALIDYMVDGTYLLTSIRPNTFAINAGENFMDVLNASDACPEQLQELIKDLKKLNQGAAINHEDYFALSEKAKGIFAVESKFSLQTDMALSMESCTLKKSLGTDMAKFADLLARLSPARPDSSSLRTYKGKFQEKYETREVPILELLNQDFGLGFPEYNSDWTFNSDEYSKQVILDEFITEAVRDQKVEVELSPETMSKLLAKAKDFEYPLSADMFVTVLADSQKEIDEGKYLLANGSALAGAGRNLGRFADMLGDDGINALKSVVKAEDEIAPNEIHAELSSLPRTFRLGNVSTVPIVRPFHIVLDSWPGDETDSDAENRKIALNDLVVGMEDSKFYLRSIKHNARVRLTTPNLMNPLFKTQISRFLSAVTADSQSFTGQLSWGTANNAAFRPRLRFEKFIISPAQWVVRVDANKREDFHKQEKFKAWLAQWRERWFVPRYVQLKEADNLLLIDLDDEHQTEELRRELINPKQNAIVLQESFCNPEDLWAMGPDGKYVSEIVASFISTQKPAVPENEGQIFADPNMIPDSDRMRCPGNEWIYLKLYAGKSVQDDIVIGNLIEFIESVKAENLIESWFFIKYADPEPHLRVRLRGDAEVLQSEVLKRVMAFCNSIVDSGLCTRFVIDSYNREIERYGGLKAIALAEEFFNADSELVVNLLRLETSEAWSLEKQMVSCLTVDRLLDSLLNLDAQTQSKWYRKHASRTEFGEDFRKHKDQLHYLFSKSYSKNQSDRAGEEQAVQELFQLIDEYAAKLKTIGQKYRELEANKELVGSFADICSSFVHMHCNRYLGIDHKAELKARTLAWRSHESRTNRKDEPHHENEVLKSVTALK